MIPYRIPLLDKHDKSRTTTGGPPLPCTPHPRTRKWEVCQWRHLRAMCNKTRLAEGAGVCDWPCNADFLRRRASRQSACKCRFPSPPISSHVTDAPAQHTKSHVLHHHDSRPPTRLNSLQEEGLMPLPYRHLAAVAPRRILNVTSHTRRLHALSHSSALRHVDQFWRAQNRGKKTKASVKLDDLPQGLIPLEALPLEDAAPVYPTVVRQARSNMQKFDNCVLLTRVGGFYELYFEQADEFAPLLNIKPGKRVAGTKNAKVIYSMVIRSDFLLLLMLTFGSERLSLLPAGSLSEDSGPRSQPICCYCRRISQPQA